MSNQPARHPGPLLPGLLRCGALLCGFLLCGALLCGSLLAAGCSTVANPASCADGFCHDPAFPFCDLDGTLGGGPPLTCIAVSCTPHELAACRGDDAVICNATGDDYDVTHCEHRCDPAEGCRGCRADDECASQVCDDSTGACASPSSIVYAHPMGSSDSGCGTETLPCTITAAFATATSTRNIIKLSPGEYTGSNLAFPNTTVATIHGFSATVRGVAPAIIAVGEGQQVTIRGLSIVNTYNIGGGISCVTTGQLVPSVALDRVSIKTASNGLGSRGCKVSIDRSEFIGTDPQFGFAIYLDSVSGGVGSEATIRRTSFRGPGGVAALNRSNAHVANCIFINNNIGVLMSDSGVGAMPGEGDIIFSTFVNSPIKCGDGPVAMTLTNNVLFGTTSNSLTEGTRCTHHFSLITPAAILPPGDHIFTNMDPKFVSVATGDFHLTASSPAIDIADPTVTVNDDFDGTKRPQGAAFDLGAFELVP